MTLPDAKSRVQPILLPCPERKTAHSTALETEKNFQLEITKWGKTTALLDAPNTIISARKANLYVCPKPLLSYIRRRASKLLGAYCYVKGEFIKDSPALRFAERWQQASWHVLLREVDVDYSLMSMMRRIAPNSDTIVLISGDSDYKAHREIFCHEQGKRVIFASFSHNTATSIRSEKDWINLAKIGVCKPRN